MKIAKIATILIFICTIAIWIYGKAEMRKQDTVVPVITSTIDVLHVDARAGVAKEGLKEGLSAFDDVDGDITGHIIVGTISPFKEKGVSDAEYVVFDSSNNVGRYERTIYFENYESPKIHLSKPLVYEVNGRISITDRLTAADMLEGDISDKIRFSSSNLTITEAGTYRLNVEVKNSYGDSVKYQLPINLVRYNCDQEYIQLMDYLKTHHYNFYHFHNNQCMPFLRHPCHSQRTNETNPLYKLLCILHLIFDFQRCFRLHTHQYQTQGRPR